MLAEKGPNPRARGLNQQRGWVKRVLCPGGDGQHLGTKNVSCFAFTFPVDGERVGEGEAGKVLG